jgi:hypothetical protein
MITRLPARAAARRPVGPALAAAGALALALALPAVSRAQSAPVGQPAQGEVFTAQFGGGTPYVELVQPKLPLDDLGASGWDLVPLSPIAPLPDLSAADLPAADGPPALVTPEPGTFALVAAAGALARPRPAAPARLTRDRGAAATLTRPAPPAARWPSPAGAARAAPSAPAPRAAARSA